MELILQKPCQFVSQNAIPLKVFYKKSCETHPIMIMIAIVIAIAKIIS
jgi:hypothetical protein